MKNIYFLLVLILIWLIALLTQVIMGGFIFTWTWFISTNSPQDLWSLYIVANFMILSYIITSGYEWDIFKVFIATLAGILGGIILYLYASINLFWDTVDGGWLWFMIFILFWVIIGFFIALGMVLVNWRKE